MQRDIIIIGGGPVGLSLGLALSKLGFATTIIEAKQSSFQDPRWFALSADVLAWLHSLGVPIEVSFVETVCLSYQSSPTITSFSAQEYGLHFLGGMMASHTLRHHLLTLSHKEPSLEILCPDHVTQWTWNDRAWHLILASGHALKASLVIGADGRNSSVRSFFAPSYYRWTFPQKAYVFSFEPFPPAIAYEHFFPGGSLALLPLLQNRGAGVWIGKDQVLKQLNVKKEVGNFLKYILKGSSLAEIGSLKDQGIFDVKAGFASRITFPRCILVGDAAQAIHPIAGQGLNLGLRSARDLVTHLDKRRHLGLDWGTMLKDFESSWRKKACSLQLFTNTVVCAFSLKPLPLLWELSALTLNHFSPLRRWMTYKAAFP